MVSNDLASTLRNYKEQFKPKCKQKKGNIKIRAEINEIESRI